MLCHLCDEYPPIENSHVIPAFVPRLLKGSPPSVGMRSADAPNKAIQDVKKYPLLCTHCEAVINQWEAPAADQIFRPFREKCQMEFEYGPWLHKFMTSLSWRTLVVKLGRYENDPTIPEQTKAELRDGRDMARKYILGECELGSQIEQHFVFWKDPSYALPDLSRIDINLVIRASMVHEILIEKKNGWSATVHNHAGCFYVMIVRSDPKDLWQGTRISPDGGTISQPQCVSGWVFNTFVQTLINTHESMRLNLSVKQREKIADGTRTDVNEVRRFINRDPNSNILE